MGKRTAQKDTITNTISDSQVNSNFPHGWSPASLTFNNYFYLFLYLHTTRITINNNTPHLKSPKNQNRRAALGRPAMKLLGVGGGGGAFTSLQLTYLNIVSYLIFFQKIIKCASDVLITIFRKRLYNVKMANILRHNNVCFLLL